jgi:hypothetical protein
VENLRFTFLAPRQRWISGVTPDIAKPFEKKGVDSKSAKFPQPLLTEIGRLPSNFALTLYCQKTIF